MHKLIIVILLALIPIQINAQQLIPAVYSIEVGSHVYYVPTQSLTFRQQEFVALNTWEFDLYASFITPIFSATLIHYPTKYWENQSALLSSQKHRLDLELMDLSLISTNFAAIRPIISAEFINLDLFYSEWDHDLKVLTNRNDSVYGFYGGVGSSFNLMFSEDLYGKAAVIAKVLRQSGWEFSTSLMWKTPKIFSVDSHITAGVKFEKTDFSWGSSSSTGFLVELGLTF
jgi:hypothetical protein